MSSLKKSVALQLISTECVCTRTYWTNSSSILSPDPSYGKTAWTPQTSPQNQGKNLNCISLEIQCYFILISVCMLNSNQLIMLTDKIPRYTNGIIPSSII